MTETMGNDTASVVMTRDGTNMHVLPSLPEPVNYNCLLALDEHRLFTAGGIQDNYGVTENPEIVKRVSLKMCTMLDKIPFLS